MAKVQKFTLYGHLQEVMGSAWSTSFVVLYSEKVLQCLLVERAAGLL